MNTTKKLKRNRLFRVIGRLFLLAVVIFLAINICGDWIATRMLKDTLAKKPMPGHLISFRALSFNLAAGNFTVKDISVIPDTSTIQAGADTARFNISLDKLLIKGVRLWKYLLKRSVEADEIIFQNPDIRITVFPADTATAIILTAADTAQIATEKKRADVKGLKADLIRVEDGFVSVWKNGEPGLSFEASQVSIIITNPEVSMAGGKKKFSEMVRFNDLQLHIPSHKALFDGGFYAMENGGLNLSVRDKSIRVDSLHLKPLYDKSEFGTKYGKQTDRFDIYLSSIVINDLDFDLFLSSGALHARHIQANGMQLEAYRDRNITFDQARRTKLYHTVLKQLKVPITIDSVMVKNSRVRYEELKPGQQTAGYVTLDALNGRIRNITNDSAAIMQNYHILVDGQFLFMGSGNVQAALRFPLNEPDEKFYFSGNLQSFDFTALNPISETNARLKFKSGVASFTEFRAEANRYSSQGQMRILYTDLDVEVLNYNEKKDETTEKLFVTDMANIMLSSENPSAGKPERVGSMTYDRDPSKGIFNYIVKTIINGATDVAVPAKKN